MKISEKMKKCIVCGKLLKSKSVIHVCSDHCREILTGGKHKKLKLPNLERLKHGGSQLE
jgi:predicted nucleic acid-binding Zn ribbon protein